MGRPNELPDEESEALVAELQRLCDAMPKSKSTDRGYRKVGRALGYGPERDSQNIEQALKRGRVGAEMGALIYALIEREEGLTREQVLRRNGVVLPRVESVAVDRVFRLAGKLDLPARRALEVHEQLAAYKGELTDEQLAKVLKREVDVVEGGARRVGLDEFSGGKTSALARSRATVPPSEPPSDEPESESAPKRSVRPPRRKSQRPKP